MGALAIIVTHQNVPCGPILTEDALAAAMRAGTVNLPDMGEGLKALIAGIFSDNTPELILGAAQEIGVDPDVVNQLYSESVADHMPRVPMWELAMRLTLFGKNPVAMKGKIHADWLQFDPEALATAIPVTWDGYVAVRHIWEYTINHDTPGLAEAFAAWYGVRATNKAGCVYAGDWRDFLSDIKRARAIAAAPFFDMPDDGIVYRCNV